MGATKEAASLLTPRRQPSVPWCLLLRVGWLIYTLETATTTTGKVQEAAAQVQKGARVQRAAQQEEQAENIPGWQPGSNPRIRVAAGRSGKGTCVRVERIASNGGGRGAYVSPWLDKHQNHLEGGGTRVLGQKRTQACRAQGGDRSGTEVAPSWRRCPAGAAKRGARTAAAGVEKDSDEGLGCNAMQRRREDSTEKGHGGQA